MLWHMSHGFPDGYALFRKHGCERGKIGFKSYAGGKPDKKV